jgi:hypothetical protein
MAVNKTNISELIKSLRTDYNYILKPKNGLFKALNELTSGFFGDFRNVFFSQTQS